MRSLLVFVALAAFLGAGGAAIVRIDWSLTGYSPSSSAVFPLSVLVSQGDVLAFTAPRDDSGATHVVQTVRDLVSREPLPSTEPGSFSRSFTSRLGSASVMVTADMVGREFFIVDPTPGHQLKRGQIIVRSADAARDHYVDVDRFVDVPYDLSSFTATDIAVGERVIFRINDLDAHRYRSWVARTTKGGTIIDEPNEAPFILGPRSLHYARTFTRDETFHYRSPLIPNVRGTIVVGEGSPDGTRLPLRNIPLQCQCLFPTQPCIGPAQPTPLPATIPPAQACQPPFCASVAGFQNVWGVSATRGSDCGGNSGSFAEPFASVGEAVCHASDGDLIIIEMGGTLQENLDSWYNCTSCVSFVLEDREANAELGSAQLASGGTVYFRRDSSDWKGRTTNFRWYNAKNYVTLKDDKLPLPTI